MKNKTTRLLRLLADIRRAQRCTALRAARAAAELERTLKEPAESDAGQYDTGKPDAPSATPGSGFRSPH